MYSGKSTLGRSLARYLNGNLGIEATFIDTDHAFEERYHLTIADCFRKYGEPMFRKLETAVLHSLADSVQPSAAANAVTQSCSHAITVVSTGGGTPCSGDNMQWMLDHGLTVYLHLSEEAILKRMAVSRKPRPILAAMPPEQRDGHVHRQLRQRVPYYQQAHLTVEAENPDVAAIAQAIIDWLPT